ncbi:peroxidase 42-like protein [Tanacetum coccineum]
MFKIRHKTIDTANNQQQTQVLPLTSTKIHAHKLKISSENKLAFFTNATRTLLFLGLETSSMIVLLRCDASLLLDSTRRTLSEKETDRSFGLRNFRYLEEIKEALERECPGVVSCADILVLSGRDGIVALYVLRKVNECRYGWMDGWMDEGGVSNV